jgi:hypothetical protein
MLPEFGGRLPSWSRWKLIQLPLMIGVPIAMGAAALFTIQVGNLQASAVNASAVATNTLGTAQGGPTWLFLMGLLFGWTAFLVTLWLYWRDPDRYALDSELAAKQWRESLREDDIDQASQDWLEEILRQREAERDTERE